MTTAMPISGQIGDMLPSRCYRRSPETSDLLGLRRADARNRTGDPFITSEVLYQLSYVGGRSRLARPGASSTSEWTVRLTRSAGALAPVLDEDRPPFVVA